MCVSAGTYLVAISPEATNGDGVQAERDDGVCYLNALPHGHMRRMFQGRWHRALQSKHTQSVTSTFFSTIFHPSCSTVLQWERKKDVFLTCYLNLQHDIVAPESEGNDPEAIQDAKCGVHVVGGLDGVVGHAGHPALGHGHDPDHGAVGDGGGGAHQGHAGDGVEVGELRQQHGRADEDKVPLHGGERARQARLAARDAKQRLHAAAADDDERRADPRRQVHHREQRQDLGPPLALR